MCNNSAHLYVLCKTVYGCDGQKWIPAPSLVLHYKGAAFTVLQINEFGLFLIIHIYQYWLHKQMRVAELGLCDMVKILYYDI